MSKFGISIILYNPSDLELQRLADIVRDYRNNGIIVSIFLNSSPDYKYISLLPDYFIYEIGYRNMGLGWGHNKNIDMLLNNGCDVFMTLDQDSRLSTDSVFKLYKDYLRCNMYAVLGPAINDRNRFVRKYKKQFNVKKYIQQSGMTLSKKVYMDMGGFREELFIGEVDKEYCKRIRDCGGECIIDSDILMYHEVGKKRVGGKKINVVLHDPLRYYYYIRNKLYLVLIGRYSKFYIVPIYIRVIMYLLLIIIYDGGRGANYIVDGLMDSFKRRMGEKNNDYGKSDRCDTYI